MKAITPRRRFGNLHQPASRAFYRETGRRIRDRRESLGMTQGELAGAIGCQRNTVTQWETGRVALPLYGLARAAEELRCDPSHLMPLGREEPR